ncbi:hypothetical protein GCM10027074_16480 [Streptomyces deserti]
MRSAADPTLCLASDTDARAVLLTGCLVHAGVVRYDLTVRGELLLRDGKGRVVAPGEGRMAVVAGRDGSAAQRWALEAGLSPGGDAGEKHESRGQGGPRGSGGPEQAQPYDGAPHVPAPEEPAAPTEPAERPQRFEKRFAPVGCCGDAGPGAADGDGDTAGRDAPGGDVPASDVLQAAASAANTAVTTVGAVLRP